MELTHCIALRWCVSGNSLWVGCGWRSCAAAGSEESEAVSFDLPLPDDLDDRRCREEYVQLLKGDEFWGSSVAYDVFYTCFYKAPESKQHFVRAFAAALRNEEHEAGVNVPTATFFAQLGRGESRDTLFDWYRSIISGCLRQDEQVVGLLGAALHMTGSPHTDDILASLVASMPGESPYRRLLEATGLCERRALVSLPLPALDSSLLEREWNDPMGSYELTPDMGMVKAEHHRRVHAGELSEERAVDSYRMFTTTVLTHNLWSCFHATGDTSYLTAVMDLAASWEEFFGSCAMFSFLDDTDLSDQPTAICDRDTWKPWSARGDKEKIRYLMARLACTQFIRTGSAHRVLRQAVDDRLEERFVRALDEAHGMMEREHAKLTGEVL